MCDGFSKFWSIYPKKTEKIYARKCYVKALREDSEESIIEGAKQYAQHCLSNGTERDFIKNPSTWLNRGCWADEYEIPQEEYASPDEARHKMRLWAFEERGFWRDEWGPKPDVKNVVRLA